MITTWLICVSLSITEHCYQLKNQSFYNELPSHGSDELYEISLKAVIFYVLHKIYL